MISVDGVVVGAGTEPGSYEILPGGSESCPVFSSTVQAVPIRGEDFADGERVDLIQIDSEFGAAKKANGIKGCFAIPEDSKAVIMAESPAMTAAAYIGLLNNLSIKPYSVGTVKAINGSALRVDYNDSIKNLFVAPGLSASDFSVDDLVVVNNWEYSSPIVIGWWVRESLKFGFSVSGSAYYSNTYLQITNINISGTYEFPRETPLKQQTVYLLNQFEGFGMRAGAGATGTGTLTGNLKNYRVSLFTYALYSSAYASPVDKAYGTNTDLENRDFSIGVTFPSKDADNRLLTTARVGIAFVPED